jgi:hypothetical protein
MWRNQFKYDPVKPLLESNNAVIHYFARRDLLQEEAGPITQVWKSRDALKILSKQNTGGYWKYPGKGPDYDLLATFKNMQQLVYKYELDRSHPALAAGCEYLLSYQTDEGDIRGFIGNQYAPYYTGIVMALLIKAGYEADPRIAKALEWLLSMRQDDGGWVIGSPGILGIPNISRDYLSYLTADKKAETVKAFDKALPFSHSGTGMVIRAFASHPDYRRSPETLQAASLLKSHFFKEDNYSSYKHPDYWIRFEFPFWWNNLIAALDSLSLIGIPPEDKDIKDALGWLVSNQTENGLWQPSYSRIHKASVNSQTAELRLWITLAVCRVFKRFFSSNSLLSL